MVDTVYVCNYRELCLHTSSCCSKFRTVLDILSLSFIATIVFCVLTIVVFWCIRERSLRNHGGVLRV
nr:hypothetical protein [Crinivirus sp.]